MDHLKQSIKLITLAMVGMIFILPSVYSQTDGFHQKIQDLTNQLLGNKRKFGNQEDSTNKIIIAQLLFEKTGDFIILEHKTSGTLETILTKKMKSFLIA